MGCDIHLHTEVKIKGKWKHYSHQNVDRYYWLFAKMANVRNGMDETPISDPKGWPQDASEISTIDKDHYGTDGHSHSWLSAVEIKQLYQWLEGLDGANKIPWDYLRKNFGYLFGNHWSDFGDEFSSVPNPVEDVRFVFFFDN